MCEMQCQCAERLMKLPTITSIELKITVEINDGNAEMIAHQIEEILAERLSYVYRSRF